MSAKAKALPSLERVTASLAYDPETGIFTRTNPLLSRRKYGNSAGGVNRNGYVYISVESKKYKAHRLAWLIVHGVDPGDMEVDHIDRNRSNNAITNLRPVSRKQNNENTGVARNNTSGFRGVSYSKAERRWIAYIKHNRKRTFLGQFVTVEEAAAARRAAEDITFTHHRPATPKA